MTIITMQHLRKLKYCSRGVRLFFEKYNLDYQKFLKEGISESDLKQTNNAMADAAILEAKK